MRGSLLARGHLRNLLHLCGHGDGRLDPTAHDHVHLTLALVQQVEVVVYLIWHYHDAGHVPEALAPRDTSRLILFTGGDLVSGCLPLFLLLV